MDPQLLFDRLNAFETITLVASFVLLLAAAPISSWLNKDDGLDTRISMMRILNVLIIAAIIVNGVLAHRYDSLSNLIKALIVVYFAVLSTQITTYLIRMRFGRRRAINNTVFFSDTYSSRGLSLLVTALVAVITIISCLRILELDSLLEAGGALGVIGLLIVTTQASWAPDIISGLIILHSRLCEEGDVVQFNLDGQVTVASVFKTKLFHSEFLDQANNHRFMVRNTRLRDLGLQNLSRFASGKGLRERLLFNIDYAHTQEEVTSMIMRAFAQIDQVESLREEHSDPEVMVFDTGDYAVTWAVYYYIKDVKRVLAIKQIFRGYILAEATRSGISLATPQLSMNTVSMSSGDSAH